MKVFYPENCKASTRDFSAIWNIKDPMGQQVTLTLHLEKVDRYVWEMLNSKTISSCIVSCENLSTQLKWEIDYCLSDLPKNSRIFFVMVPENPFASIEILSFPLSGTKRFSLRAYLESKFPFFVYFRDLYKQKKK